MKNTGCIFLAMSMSGVVALTVPGDQVEAHEEQLRDITIR